VILALREWLQGPRGSVAPDITDADLALRLGAGKTEVRQGLRRLERVGVLEVSSGFILVKDEARLEEFLEFIRNSGKP
jgi:DNA-binding GntR family transcriptional regulator